MAMYAGYPCIRRHNSKRSNWSSKWISKRKENRSRNTRHILCDFMSISCGKGEGQRTSCFRRRRAQPGKILFQTGRAQLLYASYFWYSILYSVLYHIIAPPDMDFREKTHDTILYHILPYYFRNFLLSGITLVVFPDNDARADKTFISRIFTFNLTTCSQSTTFKFIFSNSTPNMTLRIKFNGSHQGRQYMLRVGVRLSIREKLPSWHRKWCRFARHE